MSDARPVEAPDGTTLFLDGPRLLLLDLDSICAVRRFLHLLPAVEYRWPVETVRIWASRGGNLHAVVDLGVEMDLPSRLALRSDPMRTILTIRDVERANNVLFKPVVPESGT